MNNRKGIAKSKTFHIILDSECSSKILMGSLIEKLCTEKDAPMQWNTQAGNITTNLKVNAYFILPALTATNAEMWNCHMDDSAKGRYDMIL